MSTTLTQQGTRPAVIRPAYAVLASSCTSLQSNPDNKAKFDGRHEWLTDPMDSLT